MHKFMKSVIAGAMISLSIPASIAGGAAGGGSTEWTQIANNVQLAASVAKQATAVSQLIASKLLQIQQLESMMRNLQKLPQNLIAEAMAPYREQVEAFTSLHAAVKDVGNAANATRAMFEGRGLDMRKVGLDPREYIKYEFALADRRGGAYKQRMDQDLATMDAMRAKASALRSVAERTSGITGNVEGLQHLSKLSVMSAGELMEIKSALLTQNVDKAQDKQAEQETVKAKASIADSTIKAANQRNQRDEASKLKTPDMMKPWGNLEQPR